MGLQEDYLYWSMVKELSTRYDYRIITISESQKEIWLETDNSHAYPVIRLMRYDLDWANWLKRDMERTALNGEQIRKQLHKKPLQVFNIYITAFSPVDDYEYLIDSPAVNRKATIHSFIMDVSKYDEKSQQLEQLLHMPLSFKAPDHEDIDDGQVAYLKQTALSASVQKAKEERQLFTAGKPFFTYVFIILQVAVFLLMEARGGSANSSTLIEFGAKYNPLILQGEWWRFFTPIVIHIGFLHLLMNTISLYFIGPEVERIYGRLRFLFIYLFAGFAGVLGSFLQNSNISAGASGAIFGCFGALLYFGIAHPRLFFRTMGTNVIILILFNLGYGFSVDGVDNAGHVGGLVGGFLAAGMVHLPKSKQLIRQIIFTGATVCLTYWLLQWGYSSQGFANNEMVAAATAQDFMDKGEDDQAYEILKKYTEKNRDAPSSFFFTLGNFEYQKENLASAENFFVKAIEQDPEYDPAHYNLALLYLRTNRENEAESHAQKAAKLKPDDKEYQKLLDRIHQ
ncbi:rhomboid family intramembrane serine protease [Peribacillus cavernae]|uniref:Rhomboid family intramembrane serine protease n=1 Tax=Peribacillus cavernae TaxID=1674310 RepID=A0A3S0VXQ0_9BACI|nr:rhomboid family intramembrane serine protease [Peribacillus cavernae]MDQ0218313.1 rhomboid protease GluP [Peribacillus cavernae]RUQ28405.1 rhomboid family intramembrane serine protease [Peribacillus cavernae]